MAVCDGGFAVAGNEVGGVPEVSEEGAVGWAGRVKVGDVKAGGGDGEVGWRFGCAGHHGGNCDGPVCIANGRGEVTYI